MMTRTRTLLLLTLVFLFILYHFPGSSANFFDLYPHDDQPARQMREFLSRPLQTIEVEGIAWQYYRGGSGSQTVLFIHGMGGAHTIWWQQILALEHQYRTIAINLPEAVHSLEGAASGILKILDAENVPRALVVGTSMGGYIAQYLTDKYPERVEKVVFGNTFPPNKQIARENATTARLLPFVPEVLIRYLGSRQLKDKILPATHNSPLLAAVLPSLPFSKTQFMNRYKVVVDPFFPRPARYEVKRIPKLIIESDNDPLVPPELRSQLKALYPDAAVHTFHGEGHFPYINAAEVYTRTLRWSFQQPNHWQAAEAVIHQYFEGRRQGDVAKLKQVFSPSARLVRVSEGKEMLIPLSAYWQKVSRDGPVTVQTRILDGNLYGNVGVFTVQFDYPQQRFRDVLILVADDGSWKIIEKVFQPLP